MSGVDGFAHIAAETRAPSPKPDRAKGSEALVAARPAMLVPDWGWAIILGLASVVWFPLRSPLAGILPFLSPTPPLTLAVGWIVIGLLALQAVPLVWVSKRPIVVFVVVYAIFLATIAIAGDRGPAMSATMLYAALALCAYAPVVASVWLLPAAVLVDGALHAISLLTHGDPIAGADFGVYLTQLPLAYATPALAGLLFRVQRTRTRLETERATALADAADARAAEAIDAERARMSGEVHDIAAHHLSSVLLQTRAAADLLPPDSRDAHELLDAAQAETEATLDDLRQLVAALRRRDSGASNPVAAPTLTDLPGLISSVRTLYPDVEVSVHGDLAGLDPVRSLACFRLIQESLTNARKHAPGATVTVRVERSAGRVRIETINGPSDHPSAARGTEGHGLPGMRERAAVLGGTLEHGPTADGGWRVLANIPTRALR